MKSNSDILQSDKFYHIYNRANGQDDLFVSHQNYLYFLRKYKHYIQPIAETYSFCLMPNHFHFLVNIRDEAKLLKLKLFQNTILKTPEVKKHFQESSQTKKSQIISLFLTRQFSHLQNGYTQAFNKQQNRRGSLFMHPYKRKHIKDKKYLIQLICYIHHNPINANLCKQLEDWKYSSYRALISTKATALERNQVMEWFEDKDNFKFVHKNPPDLNLGYMP